MSARATRRGAGGYRAKRMSAIRRVSVDSFDAVEAGHSMLALCEFDVTRAREELARQRASGRNVSFFAFVVKAVADTIAEDLAFNSTRSGRRIVEFDDVDVNLPVETETAGEKLPRQVTVRRAQDKTVEQVRAEVDAARHCNEQSGVMGPEDARTLRLVRATALAPKWLRNLGLRAVARDPFRVKTMTGTVLVTSVGSFGDVPGYAIPYLRTPRAVSFVVGTVARKPVVVDEAVVPRDVLGMTIVFNHDIVDGAPAARFVTRLRERLEQARGLD